VNKSDRQAALALDFARARFTRARYVLDELNSPRLIRRHDPLPMQHKPRAVRSPPIVLPKRHTLVLAVDGHRVDDILRSLEVLLHQHAVVNAPKRVNLAHDVPKRRLHLLS